MTVRGFFLGGVKSQCRGIGLALVFCGFVVGCGGSDSGGYDANLRYPPRTDLVVHRLPADVPMGPAPAGRLDATIGTLPILGGKVFDPKSIPEARRQELESVLENHFGTPANPKVECPDRPTGSIGSLDLSSANLIAGSRVYRRLCVQCHGLTGDGRGPSGAWIFPYPRDFRQGEFKALEGGTKPRVETLVRLVRYGVPGTSMPIYDLISDADVQAVTAYIVHLSLRGEVEFHLLRSLLDDSGELEVSDLAGESQTVLSRTLEKWNKSQGIVTPFVIPPGDPGDSKYQESIRQGQRIFASQSCVGCHQDYGRKETYRYDVWGGAIRVTDLTRGEFKWGKEPSDIAARIRFGISSASMPAHPQFTEEQLRDLVNFVREIGYPNRLPPDVRELVYPATRK